MTQQAQDPTAFAGKWRFVYSAEMRAHWERKFREAALDGDALRAALEEVDAEAQGAQLEITARGEIASSSGGREFFRTALAHDERGVWFDKPNGARVHLRLDDGEIVADEAGKPTMRFRRAL